MIRLSLLLAALALALPASAAAGTCNISGDERELGATYVTNLRTKGVSCAKGRRVVKAFNACRKANGGADGRCNRKVRRFRCSEERFNELEGVQYDSRVVCKRGAKRVHFTYTQNV